MTANEFHTEALTRFLTLLYRKQLYNPQEGEIIYQYTNVEALVNGILGQGRKVNEEIVLRSTSIAYMNDPQEMETGDAVARDILIQAYPEGLPTDIKDEFMKHMMFITSFTPNIDCLPMWNMYGNNGHGIALGFDAKMLNQQYPAHLFHCIYDNLEKRNEIFGEWLKVLNIENNPILDDVRKLFSNEDYTPQMIAYSLLALLTKNDGYRYENEIRALCFDKLEPKFRYSQGLIVPYKETIIPKYALKEIWVGPCNDPNRAKISINNYLHALDIFHVKIKISEIPYRA